MSISWAVPRAILVGMALLLFPMNAGAQTISVLSEISPDAFSSNPYSLFAAGTDLCFMTSIGPPAAMDELWCSDGTDTGTRNVTDILPGGKFSGPTYVAAAGSTRFISSTRASSIGWELYAISETDIATPIDIHPTGSSSPLELFGFGNILLFSADDGVHGRELWRSDGTPGGTFMLLDLISGPTSSEPAEFALVGGEVFFGARDGIGGTELWKTDGTILGTVLVATVATGSNATRPTDIVDLQGIAVFTVSTSIGSSLLRSDGTPGGTSTITFFGGTPENLRAIGGSVYFSGSTGANAREPWISDGTPGGTELLKDIAPGGGIFSTSPGEFTGLGDQVLFMAQLGLGVDDELWRTEGTEVTTERVLEINPGAADEVSDLRALGNLVYFAANNGANGVELWQSDGTAGGTVQTADLLSSGGSFPRELTVFDGRLFFVATGTAEGREVFVLEPALVPSVPALSPATLGLLVIMLGGFGIASVGLWRIEREANLPSDGVG